MADTHSLPHGKTAAFARLCSQDHPARPALRGDRCVQGHAQGLLCYAEFHQRCRAAAGSKGQRIVEPQLVVGAYAFRSTSFHAYGVLGRTFQNVRYECCFLCQILLQCFEEVPKSRSALSVRPFLILSPSIFFLVAHLTPVFEFDARKGACGNAATNRP